MASTIGGTPAKGSGPLKKGGFKPIMKGGGQMSGQLTPIPKGSGRPPVTYPPVHPPGKNPVPGKNPYPRNGGFPGGKNSRMKGSLTQGGGLQGAAQRRLRRMGG
jgi:hypothetical protein